MPETRPPAVVDWYRSPLPSALFKKLHERSDFKGWLQTGGYLAVVLGTGILAFVSWWRHWPWWATLGLIFFHGTMSAFHTNGMHELGHGTVFKTKALNKFFVQVLSFFGWLNYEMFDASHQRHHRYTLHTPDDQEVVLPVKLMLKHFFQQGFFHWLLVKWVVPYQWRIARGRFQGEWELTCFPPEKPALRAEAMAWSRRLLLGHAAILAASVALSFVVGRPLWIVPVLVSMAPFYGGWLFFLCNNTQHVGLQDAVPDFRLCCRTIELNPVLRFLYWQMNYHTEHHMYAAVPCYNLKKLHEAILPDLPPCPNGLVAAWRQIIMIMRRQAVDPTYQYVAPLPGQAAVAEREVAGA